MQSNAACLLGRPLTFSEPRILISVISTQTAEIAAYFARVMLSNCRLNGRR